MLLRCGTEFLCFLKRRQKNALRMHLCIPGRNNLLFRGTTRIEKKSPDFFPTLVLNVHNPYEPTEKQICLSRSARLLRSVPFIFSSKRCSQSVTPYSCRPLKTRVSFTAFTMIPYHIIFRITLQVFLCSCTTPQPGVQPAAYSEI